MIVLGNYLLTFCLCYYQKTKKLKFLKFCTVTTIFQLNLILNFKIVEVFLLIYDLNNIITHIDMKDFFGYTYNPGINQFGLHNIHYCSLFF